MAPIAAAHLSLLQAGEQDTSKIPDEWKSFAYKAVDVLYVSPFVSLDSAAKSGTLPGVKFMTGAGKKSNAKADDDEVWIGGETPPSLVPRLEWIIKEARAQNPNIRIIAQQYANVKGTLKQVSDERIDTYVKSVRDYFDYSLYKMDGYDLYYVDDNIVTNAQSILGRIRFQLDDLTKIRNLARPLTVSITSGTTLNFDKSVVKPVNFVNIKNFGPGLVSDKAIKPWIDLGFKENQLLYGICPENTAPTNSLPIDKVQEGYKNGGKPLAGIHLWQLNSSNYTFENQVQGVIRDFLNGMKSPNSNAVQKEWISGKWNGNRG